MNRMTNTCPILCFCLLFVFSIASAEEIVLPDSDVMAESYPAEGEYLLVWFAPEYGFRETHREMARRLADVGIEVWQSNIVTSVFMPQSTSSVRQLDGNHGADLVEYAHQKTGKKILVGGDSYAATTALLAARKWQERQHQSSYLVGAILFSPYSYTHIPKLGEDPEYMPIMDATNIPIMIYQAGNSAIISQFDDVMEKLQQHGNPVYRKKMPGIMSLFYQVPPTKDMIARADKIPGSVKQMIILLDKHTIPDAPIPLNRTDEQKTGIDVELTPFNGNSNPLPINLETMNGSTFEMSDYRGQVTLINFWATWCPPCIEEIPSLNRLRNKLSGKEFQLISINYAEDKRAIIEFMDKVDVEFPVLLDYNGETASRWNVISYPSTFVIDKNGEIAYGVNAAIEWDSPDVIRQIETLMKED